MKSIGAKIEGGGAMRIASIVALFPENMRSAPLRTAFLNLLATPLPYMLVQTPEERG